MRRRCLPVIVPALVAMAVPSAAGAQAAEPVRSGSGMTWEGEGMQAGFCIHFLVDPALAEALPFGGTSLATAERAPALHPSLKTVISGAPEFAAWIPSSLCLYEYASVATPTGTVANRSDPQGFLVWSAPAADPGAPAPAEIMVSNGRLARQPTQPQVSFGRFEIEREPIPETTKEQLVLKVGKTLLTWQGRAGSDSSTATDPEEFVWRVGGTQGSVWTGRARILGTRTERAMIGALRVEGKGDLARMLGASPIRFAGPVSVGGEGQVEFTR